MLPLWGTWFNPHPRNAYHQRFCVDPACQAASKQASQRKWSRKNVSCFRGEHRVEPVRAWRRKHPGYWWRQGAGLADGCALQEVLKPQPVYDQAVDALRDRLPESRLLSAQVWVGEEET